MNVILLWLFAILLALTIALWVLGGVLSVVRRFTNDRARYARLLAKLPRTDIARATEGESVKVVGKVVLIEERVRKGPLTRRPTACSVVVVEQPLGDLTILRAVRLSSFAVEDETGQVVVHPIKAQLFIEVDTTLYSGGLDDEPPTEAMVKLLGREGLKPEHHLRLRYTEALLRPGQAVCVYGVVRSELDSGQPGGYRDVPTRRLLESGAAVPLLISNAPAALARRL